MFQKPRIRIEIRNYDIPFWRIRIEIKNHDTAICYLVIKPRIRYIFLIQRFRKEWGQIFGRVGVKIKKIKQDFK